MAADRTQKRLRRRVYFAAFFAMVWSVGIVWRLVDLQVKKRDELLSKALRQNQRVIEIDAKRGTILDRNGHELAITREVESCYGVPGKIEEPARAAAAIASALADPSLRSDLLDRFQSRKDFVWVARKLPAEAVEKIRNLDLEGIGFIAESKRFDPKEELASHLLGYVGMDNSGLAGVEYQYDRELRGMPGKVVVEIDARQREFSYSTLVPTQPGSNIILTIDEVIQYIAEHELRAAVERHHARGGSITVMNPRSGEILAMANWPTYDPNELQGSREDQRRNRAIQDCYEPGSTFKIIVAAASLAEKTARIDEKFDCQLGAIEIAGHRIRDHKPFGVLSMDEIIEYSSNVGSIKLGLRLGNQRLYSYMRAFGFGRPTGIDLPGESSGILREPKDWSLISIGALCMGQEVSVTPLQVLSATSAVANGGFAVRPRLVRQIVAAGGQGWSTPTTLPPVRIIDSTVARDLGDILTDVVERGTGIAARMDGFSTAGKTGTAQKADSKTGRYAPGKHVSSFVGFTPVENPALAMIVVIDEPEGAYYGGLIAAPVYKICAERILRYMNVFPERRQSVRPQVTYASLSRGEQAAYAAEGGGGEVDDFRPSRREPSDEEPTVESAQLSREPDGPFHEAPPTQPGPAFPDLHGKTLREVAHVLGPMGVSFDASGSGYVIDQSPRPGAPIGKRCRLVLSLQRDR
ncbi:MAG: transpeptidase family protein [Acidobacteria bacterium]|nr:transpeptidase family protein [Acidobacteriota bacterium]